MNKDAKLLEKVEEITSSIEKAAGDSGSSVGTGGMKSKIDAVKIAMASGIPTFLGKAGVPNILVDAVNREAKGTYFVSKTKLDLDQKRQWILFNSGPEGEVILKKDADLSQLGKKRLLPSKIDRVIGTFKVGSVIKILDYEQKPVGLGVVNYSSTELVQWQKEELTREEHQKEVVCNEDLVCYIEKSIPVSV